MNYCLVKDGIVINTIIYTPGDPYKPPAGCVLIPENEAEGLPRPSLDMEGNE